MKRFLLATTVLATAALAMSAQAQENQIKIGVLNDQSTSFSALGGTEVVRAVELAIEDAGGEALGNPIELVSADHQNKPDVGLAIAREWLEQDNVDAIADMANSAISLGVNTLIGEKGKVGLFVSPLTDRPTEADCNGHVVAWAYDAYSTVGTTVKALLEGGGKKFFILSPDYEAGKVQEAWVETAVTDGGGEIMGKIRAPLGTTDFSSYLLQAQSSRAKIVGLANAGGDTTNAVKQAAEFGIVQGGQKLASLLLFINDVHSLGLKVANGLQMTETFYWDLNDATRGFSKRFSERSKNHVMPSMVQAGDYSAVTHYLKALVALGGNPHDGAKVVAKMKEMPTDDPIFGKGSIRADGRKIHPAYLFEVKKPEESKGPWDYYKLISTIPAEEAFRPLAESECPLVKK